MPLPSNIKTQANSMQCTHWPHECHSSHALLTANGWRQLVCLTLNRFWQIQFSGVCQYCSNATLVVYGMNVEASQKILRTKLLDISSGMLWLKQQLINSFKSKCPVELNATHHDAPPNPTCYPLDAADCTAMHRSSLWPSRARARRRRGAASARRGARHPRAASSRRSRRPGSAGAGACREPPAPAPPPASASSGAARPLPG